MNNVNVLTGYKSTDVGVIPEDWKVNSLSEIAEIIMGQSPTGSSYNKKEKGIALINGPTEFTEKHPIKIQWTTSPTKLCKSEDILLCIRGSSTGRMNVSNDDYCIGRGITAIRARENSDNLFLKFMVQNAVKNLLALSAGSTFPNLDSKSLRKIEIVSPPLPEQKEIARVLSDVDELIREWDSLLAKKRDIKQGTMQQLLTSKKRLPGFSGEWEDKKLLDISTEIGDGIHSTPKYINLSEFHFINGNNLINGFIQITENTKCISQDEYYKHRKDLSKRTILISINGTIGNIALFENEKVILGKSAAYININKSVFKKYIFYFLQTHTVKSFFEDELTGTTIRNLSLQSIRNTPIQIPPTLPEQKAIAQILSDMDAEIEALEQKRDKYKAIKQGMMQELLTGKTRLIDNG